MGEDRISIFQRDRLYPSSHHSHWCPRPLITLLIHHRIKVKRSQRPRPPHERFHSSLLGCDSYDPFVVSSIVTDVLTSPYTLELADVQRPHVRVGLGVGLGEEADVLLCFGCDYVFVEPADEGLGEDLGGGEDVEERVVMPV